MGHNDRRRWMPATEGFERASTAGRTWRLRPLGGGWRLERVDPAAVGWLGGAGESATPVWDADAEAACRAMADHVDRHEALAARLAGRTASLARPSPIPGIALRGGLEDNRFWVEAVAEATGEVVGEYGGNLDGWLPAWVLGEATFSGGSRVDRELIGKGLGRALYDAGAELAGLPLTPHGRFGVSGGRTPYSVAFWDKRAAATRVPGVDDPAVEARDAERRRVRRLLDLSADHAARDPHLAAALAFATGWEVAYLPDPKGGASEAWCVRPGGGAFSGRGADDAMRPPGGAATPARTDGPGLAALLAEAGTDDPEASRTLTRWAIIRAADDAALVLARHAGLAVDAERVQDEILEALRPAGAPTP